MFAAKRQNFYYPARSRLSKHPNKIIEENKTYFKNFDIFFIGFTESSSHAKLFSIRGSILTTFRRALPFAP